MDDKQSEIRERYLGIGVAVGSGSGVASGAGLGVAFGNLALGIGFGIAVGVAVGLIFGNKYARPSCQFCGGTSGAASRFSG